MAERKQSGPTWTTRRRGRDLFLVFERGEIHQEFTVGVGRSSAWMQRMLRRAMRSVAPDREARPIREKYA